MIEKYQDQFAPWRPANPPYIETQHCYVRRNKKLVAMYAEFMPGADKRKHLRENVPKVATQIIYKLMR